jgi:hypothetical protein
MASFEEAKKAFRKGKNVYYKGNYQVKRTIEFQELNFHLGFPEERICAECEDTSNYIEAYEYKAYLCQSQISPKHFDVLLQKYCGEFKCQLYRLSLFEFSILIGSKDYGNNWVIE